MWQTIVTVIVLIAAAVYVTRHFLRVYRTGNDPMCSGCSSSGCCGGKPDLDRTCAEEGSLSGREGEKKLRQD